VEILAGEIAAIFIEMQIPLPKKNGPKIVPMAMTFGGCLAERVSEPGDVLLSLTRSKCS
jgi:hypothetical protein